MLASPPDLALGDAPRLLRRWRDQPASLLLLTSPAHTLDLIAPCLPLALKTMLCPIDLRVDAAQARRTRGSRPWRRAAHSHAAPSPATPVLRSRPDVLGAPQACLLLEQLQPRRVLCLDDEPAGPRGAPTNAAPLATAYAAAATARDPAVAAAAAAAAATAVGAASVDVRCSSAAVERLALRTPVTLNFERRFVHARMPASAARAVSLRPLREGVRGSRVRATLGRANDGGLLLQPCAATAEAAVATNGADEEELSSLYGEPDMPALLAALRKRGLPPGLEEGPTKVVRLGGAQGARVELRPHESTVHLEHPNQACGTLVVEALREQLL